MINMVRSLFVWSKDLWNGERGQNGDLSTAKYVFADKADEKEKKEWPFCSLYYEEGTADDNGGTPVAFAEKSMPWQGGTLKLRTVRCSYPNGSTKDFTFPDPKSVSQDYDLRQAGQSGQVNYTPLGMKDGVRQGGVSFHVDEIMSMEASADKNREKVKEFLAKQIDAKISGAMNAESMGAESMDAQGYDDKMDESMGMRHRGKHSQSMKDRRDEASAMDKMHSRMGRKYDDVGTMDAETFESEYSVERVNPTVVEGNADVYGAETFSADSSMMDDVMIDESSMDTVYPEGDGRIMGQSIASSDLTPLGSRAENGETEMVAFEESPMDLVMPEGEGNVIGQSTPTTDFTPFGARAEEGFTNEGFAMEGFFPDGDGRAFGDITAKANFTPISRAEDKPRETRLPNMSEKRRRMNRGSSRFGMGSSASRGQSPFTRASEGITDNDGFYPNGDGRIIGSITPEDQYEPFGYNAEEFNAYDDPITDRQKYKIGKLGGRMKSGMNRSKASDYIKELQGRESGTWRAESPMADDVMIDESSMDTVYPEGDGRIMGQSIANTDFTPLGSRADTMKSGFFKGVAGAFLVGLVANMAMAKKDKTDVPETDNENGE
tara:strand:- start:6419 stop:8233 length:1815 start_codon:yes stop_codon:yes gene_type:complete